jgi:hypothetical protein
MSAALRHCALCPCRFSCALRNDKEDGRTGAAAHGSHLHIDSVDHSVYRINPIPGVLDAIDPMAGPAGKAEALTRIRRGAAGVARLVLLALCLQLALPLLGGSNLAAAGAGDSRLQTDLAATICHAGGAAEVPAGGSAAQAGLGHCIFCLPISTASLAAAPLLIAPAPTLRGAVGLSTPDYRLPASRCPAFARSRAPPSDPLVT